MQIEPERPRHQQLYSGCVLMKIVRQLLWSKCDIKITLPPCFSIASIVGFAASIRVASVTLKFSSKGTLKSTRIIAFYFEIEII
jgi:hypothetical protein